MTNDKPAAPAKVGKQDPKSDAQSTNDDQQLDRLLDNIPNAQRLPKEQQREIMLLMRSVASRYEGPIPPASELKKYEEALPGAADRIIKMAERQQEHRMSLQSKQLDYSYTDSHLGIVLGFIIAVLVIGAGTYIAVTTSTGIGVSVIFGSLVALVGTFIYGSRSTPRSNKSKSQNKKNAQRSGEDNSDSPDKSSEKAD
ncbi:DUF2335 domain-containing protein [Schleiferilactobacillus harbinensis]|uniref:DUF2335 domain-containing protein n=1 Tax=Schleiferilactobacillus harbinensis TaxID=304207 RepID=UPI00116AA7B3|nr:DUF2335 domain-containing protein [Schleiferilactobacillus harbinensis]GEK07503.1 hypothetical protein LHA01_27420 [Schleiferilactobacillus harbinensis]